MNALFFMQCVSIIISDSAHEEERDQHSRVLEFVDLSVLVFDLI